MTIFMYNTTKCYHPEEITPNACEIFITYNNTDILSNKIYKYHVKGTIEVLGVGTISYNHTESFRSPLSKHEYHGFGPCHFINRGLIKDNIKPCFINMTINNCSFDIFNELTKWLIFGLALFYIIFIIPNISEHSIY